MALCISAPSVAAAAKTDVVVLGNGDRITCEVKELTQGLLRLSTDYMSTVYVEWEHVVELSAKNRYEVELSTGERYFGYLAPGQAPRQLAIGGVENPEDFDSVVKISLLEESFWDRLKGSFDLGLSFTQANKATQWNFDAELRYRTRKYSSKVFLSSLLTDQENADRQSRQSGEYRFQRFFKKQWFALTSVAANVNEELALDLRTEVEIAGGRDLVQSNRTVLSASAGVAYTREDYVDNPIENSAEGVVTVDFAYFTFGAHETKITAAVSVLPSLTSSGVRVNADLDLRREVFEDFFVKIVIFEDYDSDPPRADVVKNDFGVITSFGWSF